MKRIILVFLVATACQKEAVKKEGIRPDYILFGHFYGECVGEKCVEIYKLTNDSLYEDTKDEYPSSSHGYDGDFELLDQSLNEKVKDLRNSIPRDLFAINSIIVGQPDAGDWGGIYFDGTW